MTGAGLLEREAEVEAVARAIAQAAGGAGSVVMVEGPAGVGRTALLDAARDAATGAGVLSLRARGADFERGFALGIVRQLFDDVVHGEDADLFAGAARAAAPVLAGAAPLPSEDPFAARHALYRLTANLAGRRPLAILVDDVHWADPESIAVLAHIANRIESMPVALVVAARSEEPGAAHDPLQREATLLRPAPLSERATAKVVRSYAPGSDDDLCRVCHEVTGGNPFLLHELARSDLAHRREVAEALRAPDYCPERVTREIAARLDRLPGAAARLARATAVLGPGTPLRRAAELAGIGLDEAGEAADALVAAGVLRQVHPLGFRQKLVGAAVYAALGPGARSAEHARAARMLAGEKAAPEAVADHLLRCQPAGDRWAFERLVAAAHQVAARGAADAHAGFLRRALAEPAPPELRAVLLLELSEAESTAADPVAAVGYLREALAGELDPGQRFRAAMLLAGLLGHTARPGHAVDLLEAELAALAGDATRQRQAEVALVNVARTDPITRPRALEPSERFRAALDEGDPAVLGAVAGELAMSGGACAEEVGRTAEPALAAFDATATSVAGWSGWNAIRALIVSEGYDVALRALDRGLEMAGRRGGAIDIGTVRNARAELHLLTGDLEAAEADARGLHELASSFDWPVGRAWAAARLSDVLVERGRLGEAAELFADPEYAGPARAFRQIYPSAWLLLARGRLRRAQGRAEEAVHDLREAGQRATEIGHVNPAAVGWRAELVHALADLDREAEAAPLAAEELERARAFGAPRALAVALRSSARVAEPSDAIALLREAVDLTESSPAQLDRARAFADLGAALREVGSVEDARGALRIAVELAHLCGAQSLADEALEELRATGARPRRRMTTGTGALTPSERRIVELAAAGCQNREIAEALFITRHTVEFHLRNAYRKLEITSRTQLAAALAPEEEPALALAA
jgi:DNA-binding CsgD family transcriptional regulator